MMTDNKPKFSYRIVSSYSSKNPKSGRDKMRSTMSLDIILRFYSATGLLLFVGGIAYFLLTVFEINLTQSQTIAVLVSGSGLAISMLSRILLSARKQVYARARIDDNLSTTSGAVVELWNSFESTARRVLSIDGHGRSLPLRGLIAALQARGFISEEEFLELHEALNVRNRVVHGDGDRPALQEITDTADTLYDIIDRLDRRRLNMDDKGS